MKLIPCVVLGLVLFIPGLSFSAAGDVPVNVVTTFAGEDPINDVQKVEQRYLYRNITTATNTEVQNQSGRLHAIVVNTAVASGVIAIYDGLNSTTCSGGGGALIGTITMPATLLQNHFVMPYNTSFGTGLCITTTGTPNITVMYK